MRRERGRRDGYARAWMSCLGVLAAAGIACAQAEPSADAVREAIRDYIDASDGSVSLADPTGEGMVELMFDQLHEGVKATEGGRQVACVDFRSSDGQLYDVDFYVGGAAGSRAPSVEDVVVHKVEGKDVLPADLRAELDRKS